MTSTDHAASVPAVSVRAVPLDVIVTRWGLSVASMPAPPDRQANHPTWSVMMTAWRPTGRSKEIDVAQALR